MTHRHTVHSQVDATNTNDRTPNRCNKKTIGRRILITVNVQKMDAIKEIMANQ